MWPRQFFRLPCRQVSLQDLFRFFCSQLKKSSEEADSSRSGLIEKIKESETERSKMTRNLVRLEKHIEDLQEREESSRKLVQNKDQEIELLQAEVTTVY